MSFIAVRLRLVLVGLHLLAGAAQVALLFPLAGERWRQRLVRAWSRQLLRILGIRIDAAGFDTSRLGRGLLVGNHVSFIDIVVIDALLPSAFVAKSDVARWPLIGWLARNTGTVFIERGRRQDANRTRRLMHRALEAGHRLAIFPEGTTSAGHQVLPFHSALFQSAIDAAQPVHAIALSYHEAGGAPSAAPAYIDDLSLMDCLLRILGTRGLEVRIRHAASYLPPLDDRRHLARRAHQAVSQALDTVLRAEHPPVDSGKRRGIPSEGLAQPVRNPAAISP